MPQLLILIWHVLGLADPSVLFALKRQFAPPPDCGAVNPIVIFPFSATQNLANRGVASVRILINKVSKRFVQSVNVFCASAGDGACRVIKQQMSMNFFMVSPQWRTGIIKMLYGKHSPFKARFIIKH